MIFIHRYREENGRIIGPPQWWFDEAERQTALAVIDGPSHEVSDLYKDPAVKLSLEKLFHSKCAYCETPLDEWDVEHYRPKGRVAERPDHPGYYWLAYDWENLYPACKFCNQHRKDAALWDDPKSLPGAGKADKFPLDDEARRAMTPHDLVDRELPRLLDPNVDAPEQYLGFDPQGQIFALDDDPFGEDTIRLCHLKRRRLRLRRQRVMREVVDLLKVARLAEDTGNMRVARRIRRCIRKNYAHDSAPHAAVARAVVGDPDAFGVG